jgi:uncharacterized protein DUF5996
VVLHRRDRVVVAPALPALPLAQWQATKDTLHMWLQMIGKLRLELSPAEPEWAHVALYVTSRGLTTGPLPYRDRTFEVDVDLVSHEVRIRASDGRERSLRLEPRTVAAFFADLFAMLESIDIVVHISQMPQEVPDPIPFEKDTKHASYDPDAANRFWRQLSFVDTVFKEHRAPFTGRHSPVHFFWGSFDLAYTRYSGKTAAPPPGAGRMMQVAMDVEEIYAGYWPGDARYPEPALGAYAYPKPSGIESREVGPSGAFWHEQIGLFLLPFETVRTAPDPVAALHEFLTTTFDECRSCAEWATA